MRRYMDEIFDKIEELLRPQDAVPTDEPVIDVDESVPDALDSTSLDVGALGDLIASRFPKDETGDQLSHAVLIAQLAALGITTAGQLEATLSDLEEGQVSADGLPDCHDRSPEGGRRTPRRFPRPLR